MKEGTSFQQRYLKARAILWGTERQSSERPRDQAEGEAGEGNRRMKWKVGEVQSTQNSHSGSAGSGFVVSDDKGNPLVSFGYLHATDAEAARRLVVEALANAADIHPYG